MGRTTDMETTVVFGRYENLVGSYCGPSCVDKSPLAVLLLTPGMLHHVGPMGLHVQLARRLANSGIASLRYDLSGIGESLAVGTVGSSLERATEEAIQAMDWMQHAHGYQKFALFGLCSGADDALAIAQHDSRVVGLSLMDGLGYRTRKFYLHWFLHKHLPKIASASKWTALLRSVLGRGSYESNTMPLGQDIREFPERAETERQLRRLLERDVQLQLIYTGGAIDYYSYERQFDDIFPAFREHPHISTQHYPSMDHVTTLATDRQQLLSELVRWLCKLNGRIAEREGAVECNGFAEDGVPACSACLSDSV